jgi:hypothetical protein
MSGIWDRFTAILGLDGKRRTVSERPTIRLQLEQLEKRDVPSAASYANYQLAVGMVSAEINQAFPIITNALNNLTTQYQQFVVQVVDTFFPGLENATQAAVSTFQGASTVVSQSTLFNVNGQAVNSLQSNP